MLLVSSRTDISLVSSRNDMSPVSSRTYMSPVSSRTYMSLASSRTYMSLASSRTAPSNASPSLHPRVLLVGELMVDHEKLCTLFAIDEVLLIDAELYVDAPLDHGCSAIPRFSNPSIVGWAPRRYLRANMIDDGRPSQSLQGPYAQVTSSRNFGHVPRYICKACVARRLALR